MQVKRRQLLRFAVTAGTMVIAGDNGGTTAMPYPHRPSHNHPNPGPHHHPVPTPVPDPTPAPPLPSPSKFTFADEFDGPAGSPPNPAKWAHETGPGVNFGSTGELETYVNSTINCYQDGNSNLVIAATRTGSGYNSARINTLGKFSQQGGYFEARIKLNSQPGLWPAFWMMGQDIDVVGWPACGEVDILEDYGKSTVETTVHTPNGATTFSKYTDIQSDTNWHVYTLHWNYAAYMFTFYRDGTQYLQVGGADLPATSWIFGPDTPNNGGMYFLLNMAVGGFVGTPPASTRFPAEMLIDYVRAWQ